MKQTNLQSYYNSYVFMQQMEKQNVLDQIVDGNPQI